MADLLKKIKSAVIVEDDDEIDGGYQVDKKKVIADVEVFDPNSFDDASDIALVLKHNKSALINIHKLDPSAAQRLLDYLSGCCYALDANLKQVGDDVFLLSPKGITVNGDVQQ